MSKEAKIKAEIAEYQALIDDPSSQPDEKAFAKDAIAELEGELAKLNESGSKPVKKSSSKGSKSFGKYNDWYNKLSPENAERVMEGAAESHWSELNDSEKKAIYNKYKTRLEKPKAAAGKLKLPKNKKPIKVKKGKSYYHSTYQQVEVTNLTKQLVTFTYGKEGEKHSETEPLSRFAINSYYKKPKDKKVKSIGTYKGRPLTDLDEAACEELLADIRARRKKSIESSAKSRSKPVVEKVAANVVTAVKQAITEVPVKDITEAKIKKFKQLETAGKEFMNAVKSVIGDEYDKSAVEEEFKPITDLIKTLSEKYTK